MIIIIYLFIVFGTKKNGGWITHLLSIISPATQRCNAATTLSSLVSTMYVKTEDTPPRLPPPTYIDKDAEINLIERNGKSPTLMVVMLHGLHGTIKDFSNRLVPRLSKVSKESCMVVMPTCNQGKYIQLIGSNTTNGTKDCAERAMVVLKRILKSHPRSSTLRDVIVLGHSFGGIYARYLCKLMVDENIIPKRLNPLHFISVATPHLGIRRKKSAFFSIFKAIAPVFAGTTYVFSILSLSLSLCPYVCRSDNNNNNNT